MTMLINRDPVLEKFQKHLESFGIRSKVLEEKLDFEYDYVDSHLLGDKDGIGGAGVLKLLDSPIDHVHLIKKQEFAKCDFAVGGSVGMGVHIHTWWKIRFFLSFPESITLGPFDIGTITTIKKGKFHSKVDSFLWSGYPKLTTLPPGLVRDNVADALYSNQLLRQLMIKCLLKERKITVSRYTNHKLNVTPTNSKIIIESTWKLQKNLFLDNDTIIMYEKIAEIVKLIVNALKYHLRS
ncbi:MAG: hypothetical protein KGZ37_08395 [Nitrosarchaeum sp.]|nr:hypothetical protein [Nitrosarchaeum sp.]